MFKYLKYTLQHWCFCLSAMSDIHLITLVDSRGIKHVVRVVYFCLYASVHPPPNIGSRSIMFLEVHPSLSVR